MSNVPQQLLALSRSWVTTKAKEGQRKQIYDNCRQCTLKTTLAQEDASVDTAFQEKGCLSLNYLTDTDRPL